jgi:hypothetical protein
MSLSYEALSIWGGLSICRQAELERNILEIVKAVEAHPRGEEPRRLEIRITD